MIKPKIAPWQFKPDPQNLFKTKFHSFVDVIELVSHCNCKSWNTCKSVKLFQSFRISLFQRSSCLLRCWVLFRLEEGTHIILEKLWLENFIENLEFLLKLNRLLSWILSINVAIYCPESPKYCYSRLKFLVEERLISLLVDIWRYKWTDVLMMERFLVQKMFFFANACY